MKLDVLAIGAHPDDVELSCAGIMIKLVKQGRRIGLLDLTGGEMGTRGSEEIRAQEALDSARIMGASVRENLGLPDGNIETHLANRLKVIQVIRRYKPDVLIFPYQLERHPDHEHAFTLCREAWFAAGLARLGTTDQGAPQEAWRPRHYYNFMQWYEFEPTFIVDISDEFEQRMQCVHAFKSQFYNPESREPATVLSSPQFLKALEARMVHFGDRIGVRYGEPLYSVWPLKINDVFELNS